MHSSLFAALGGLLLLFLQAPEAARNRQPGATSSSNAPPGMAFAIPKRPEPGKEPKLVCKVREHDFGAVDEGDVLVARFPFTNEGSGDLFILTANLLCGCIRYFEVTVEGKPYTWGDPIAPGKSGVFAVHMYTASFGAVPAFDKTSGVDVFTNDPALPASPVASFGAFPLRVRALISRVFEWEGNEKGMLSLGPVVNLADFETSLVLRNVRGKAFEVKSIVPDKHPKIKVDPEPDLTKSRWSFHIKVPKGQEVQSVTQQFVITTDTGPGGAVIDQDGPNGKGLYTRTSGTMPMSFWVLASITGVVTTDPQTQVNFAMMQKGKGGMRQVIVRNSHPTAPLKISNIRMLKTSDPKSTKGEPGAAQADENVIANVTITPRETEPGKQAALLVEVKPTMPEGPFYFRLAFDTNIENGPATIVVPVTGYIR